MDSSCGFQERLINDGKCVATECLVAATLMCTVGGFSASIVSHRLGEAFQHLQSGWLSPSGTTLENM